MKKIKFGIVGTAEIAFRRFLPALMKNNNFVYSGVASRNIEKTKPFCEKFGGIGYGDYDSIISDDTIDAIYIALPPSMHYEWTKKALNSGKHVLVEKPFTICIEHTRELLELANKKDLAVHENYMFLFHKQLEVIKNIVENDTIGEIRLIRSSFGFPKRSENDFRYKKELGGGALFDCGGYPISLATELLGDNIDVLASSLGFLPDYDVDMYGALTLRGKTGQVAQISFGMDNSYKCELELWGSKATLYTDRIFTAGPNFKPRIIIKSDSEEIVQLNEDDHFLGSIQHFYESIVDRKARANNYYKIENQSRIIELIRKGEKHGNI